MKFKILNEAISLGKPFSEITEEDVLKYLKLGSRDGQYFFIPTGKNQNELSEPTTGSFDEFNKGQIETLLEDGGIDDCVNFISSLQFPLKIYRGLLLKSDDDLNLKNLGHHWTVNSNLFFGDCTGLKCCNYDEDITHVIIAKINNQNDIDLEATLSLYAENSAGEYGRNWDETEDEVYISDLTKIKILGIMPLKDFEYSRMRY